MCVDLYCAVEKENIMMIPFLSFLSGFLLFLLLFLLLFPRNSTKFEKNNFLVINSVQLWILGGGGGSVK